MAAVLKLLLDNAQWTLTKVEMIEKVGHFFSATFPTPEELFSELSELHEAQQNWINIWIQACSFTAMPMVLFFAL